MTDDLRTETFFPWVARHRVTRKILLINKSGVPVQRGSRQAIIDFLNGTSRRGLYDPERVTMTMVYTP